VPVRLIPRGGVHRCKVSTDRGSATLSVAGACVALAMAGGIASVAGFGVIQAQRSQDSVDLAALAAADVLHGVASGQPCEVALNLLEIQGLSLESCLLDNAGASVHASARIAVIIREFRARAVVTNAGA